MTDYDRTDIPAGYDRGRDLAPDMLALWMNVLSSHLVQRPARILDLGCGTGRFSCALAVRFGARVIGIDPSFKMIELAAPKPRRGLVDYQLGRAEALPIRSDSVDLIFMSMSLHHFSNAQLAVTECRRILRNRGTVIVRTGTREQIPSYPYYPFIPTTHAIMEEVLPARAALRALFETSGLRLIASDLISQTVAPSWESYADKLAANADSVLARLTREDFAEGIAAVRRHSAQMPNEPVVEAIDLLVFRPAK